MAERADDFIEQLLNSGEGPESQQTAIERSRPPSPRIHTGERAPEWPSPEARASMKYVGDFARVTLDEAALGTMRPINTAVYGTIGGIKNIFNGEEGGDPIRAMGKGYADAYNEIDTLLDDSQENLGFGGTLLASLMGNAAPFGAARYIDEAFDATRALGSQIKKLTFGDKAARAGQAALFGGSTAALQSYFQGNTTVEDLVTSGAFGAGVGGLMQRLVGDRALPAITNIRNAEGELMRRIADTGPGVSRNLNLRSIAEAVDKGQFTNRGWLTAKVGNSPNYRQWEKLNDAMAEYAFAGVPRGKIDDKAIAKAEKRFAEAYNSVDAAIDTVNREARDTFRVALDRPEGRKAALYENNQLLREARDAYKLMTSTATPNSMGNRPFSPQDLIDMGDAALLKDLGRNDIAQLSPPMAKIRNEFKDLLRGREVQAVAQDVQNIPSQGVNSPRAKDVIPKSLPLYRLIDARSQLSDMLSPAMAFQNGYSKSELKAGKILLNQIDEYLDVQTNRGFGLARGAFAKGMQVEEAFDLGKKIYNQRMIEVTDKEGFASFYGDYVTEMVDDIKDPDVLASFRDGFKQAMFDQVGRRGFLEEMQYFIGPPETAGETFFKGKGENYNLMLKLLGERDTATIMELYRNGGHQERVMALFRDNLEAAGADEKAAFELSRTLKDGNVLGINPADEGVLIRATRSMYLKALKPSDRRMGEAAFDLLTSEGAELDALISKGVKSAVGGVPISIGSRMGGTFDVGMVTETSSEAADREREEAEMAARTEQLKDYFRSLGIEQD